MRALRAPAQFLMPLLEHGGDPVAGEHRRGVALDLRDAVAGERGESGGDRRIGSELDVPRAPGFGGGPHRERVATGCLAVMLDTDRQIGGERRSELEKT